MRTSLTVSSKALDPSADREPRCLRLLKATLNAFVAEEMALEDLGA
jgi:hypothetical protein